MRGRDIQRALRACGWPLRVDGDVGPITREAVRDFQRGFAYLIDVYPLEVDGRVGKNTAFALRWSVKRGGRCSKHFFFREFRSKGNGWIRVHHELVRGLEEYRRAVGGRVVIVSGYRDPAHNQRVGGADRSQHLYGTGCDLFPELSSERVRGMKRFSGIGRQGSNGLVRHVDVRHASGNNLTGGSPSNPTQWVYA